MLVGIVTKNSILIVEFANRLRDEDLDLIAATGRPGPWRDGHWHAPTAVAR